MSVGTTGGLAAVLVDAPTLEAAARLELVRTLVATAGVDIGRIAQPASRPCPRLGVSHDDVAVTGTAHMSPVSD